MPKLRSLFCFYTYIYMVLGTLNAQEQTYQWKSSVLKEQQALDSLISSGTYKKTLGPDILEKNINILRSAGYFTARIDSTIKSNSKQTFFVSLGPKTNIASLRDSLDSDATHIAIADIEKYLTQKNNELIENGFTFSRVRLKNIRFRKDTLLADVHIQKNTTRRIDRVVIKGVDHFPKKFLRHYFDISKQTLLTPKKIENISRKTAQLSFVSERKKPEILFSKDSTILYLYLKKRSANKFDGLLNAGNQDNKAQVTLMGHLDLNLSNAFKKGEDLRLFWKNNGNNKQLFEVDFSIPYLFNTKTVTDGRFQLYRNDSTFTNSLIRINSRYPIGRHIELGISFESESSSTQNQSTTIQPFKRYFFGPQISYKTPLSRALKITISAGFGRKTSNNIKKREFKIAVETNSSFQLNQRMTFEINTFAKHLNNQNNVNEQFRVGGSDNLRGFDEQSIFTNSYIIINTETGFLTNKRDKLYLILDSGSIKTTFGKHKLHFGFGGGYRFKRASTTYDLSLAIGKSPNTPIDFNKGKLTIMITSNF